MSAADVHWTDRAPDDWDELLAEDRGASPALAAGIVEAFAAVDPSRSCVFALVREGGRTIGGLPVVIERRASLRWLHALPMLLPAAPVARAGTHARVDEAIARALAALALEPDVAGGEWAVLRAEGPAVDATALEDLPGETREELAAVVRLERGLEPALARMDRKHRQSLQALRERGFTFAEAPHALDEVYALHVAQGRAWRGFRPLPLALSRRMLDARGPAPVARLFVLRRGAECVAGAFAMDGPHETFAWWSGTHASARARGASVLLLWSIVEWAAAHGRRRVSLGASASREPVAAFKRSLGAELVAAPVRWLAPARGAWPSRAAAWLQARLRARRARERAS